MMSATLHPKRARVNEGSIAGYRMHPRYLSPVWRSVAACISLLEALRRDPPPAPARRFASGSARTSGHDRPALSGHQSLLRTRRRGTSRRRSRRDARPAGRGGGVVDPRPDARRARRGHRCRRGAVRPHLGAGPDRSKADAGRPGGEPNRTALPALPLADRRGGDRRGGPGGLPRGGSAGGRLGRPAAVRGGPRPGARPSTTRASDATASRTREAHPIPRSGPEAGRSLRADRPGTEGARWS
jgi:hypothetical protein